MKGLTQSRAFGDEYLAMTPVCTDVVEKPGAAPGRVEVELAVHDADGIDITGGVEGDPADR